MQVVRRIRPMTRAGNLIDRYEMSNGAIYWANRHGWLIDEAGEPVPHPLVDDVMRAIIAWESQAGE